MSLHSPFSAALLPMAIAAAILSTHTFAENSPDDLETLTIYSDTYRNTASKSALEPEETPQGITIVSKEEIEQRSAKSLSEAMRYTPGVTTETRGGSVSRIDLLSVRGFTNLEHYYDGLPLLYNGSWTQPQIDAATIDQVEVFKGPTSVLYGAMPPGGMVNIISNQPSGEEKNSIALKLGTQNSAALTFKSQGNVADNDALTYSLTGLTNKSDSQSAHAEEKRSLLTGNLNWQASPDTLINLNFYRQSDPEQGTVSGIPAKGTIFNNINGKINKDTHAGDNNWTASETEVAMSGYKINHNINDNWTFLHNARYTSSDTLQKDLYSTVLAADQRTLSRGAYLLDENNHGFAIDNQLAGTIEFDNIEHNLLIGTDIRQLKSHLITAYGAAPTLDLFAPNYDQIDPNMPTSKLYDHKAKTKQVGLYFQDQIRIDNLVLIAGTRYDDYKSVDEGLFNGVQGKNKVRATEVTSRIGVLYNFENGISPFASYSESFEPERGVDRFGNAFIPSRAKQLEIGFKYSPLGSDTAATLSLFKINKDKNLTDDPNDPGTKLVQTGEVESKGIELSLKHALTDALSFDFNATAMDVNFKKDTKIEGNTPVWVAEKTASLWVNYQLPQSVLADSQLGLGLRYVGNTQVDAANSATVPSYSVMDLAFNMDLSKVTKLEGASFAVSVNNVFDKDYAICYDSNTCWYGAQRSVEATFKYSF
jgi:iron complex outermembrane receptor protein